jgi:hypothetical protein
MPKPGTNPKAPYAGQRRYGKMPAKGGPQANETAEQKQRRERAQEAYLHEHGWGQ